MLTLMKTGGFTPLLRAPDDGDGDGGMEDADARAMRSIKDKLERAQNAEEEDDEDDFEVQVGPATHEPRDDEEPSPRVERRRERMSLREEAERLREENARLRAATPPAYQQPPQQQLSPQQPSLDQIREFLDGEFVRIQKEEIELERTVSAHVTAKTMTPELLESLMAKQRQLHKERAVTQSRWAEAEDGTIMRRFQPRQPQVDPATAALNAEYADVAQDPNAARYASSYYQREAARIEMGERPRVPPHALRREAWEAGRGLLEGKQPGNGARRPAPTQERKAKYTGMTSNSAGGGAPAGVKNVSITPQEDLMAQERFKHLKDPAARRKAFVKMKEEKARKRERVG